jgi:glycosyltransferase
MPPHPTFFVRKTVYDQFGAFHPRLRSAADYELMLRFLFRHRISTCYVPRVLVHMRSGGQSNASVRHRIRANREDREAWRINDLRPYPFTLLLKPVRKIGQFFIRPSLPS